MTFDDDRRSEALATPHEFPQAWWTVLHGTHGTPEDFQASPPGSKFQECRAGSCRASDAPGCCSRPQPPCSR